MAVINLSQEAAQDIAYATTGIFDDVILPAVKAIYDAAEFLGNNPVAEGLREKCVTFQQKYNDQCVPRANAVVSEINKVSDFAEMMANMQADTSITSQVSGEIKTGQFDAALEL